MENQVNTDIMTADDSVAELERLADLADDVVRRARAAGASQAEVSASVSTGLSVNVRLGEVETVERNRDRGFGLTVFFGQRKGSASTADLKPASIDATIAQACAIARYTEPDPCAGLADAALMQTAFPDLDLWHPWQLDVDRAIDIGREVEAAGRDHDAITNSEGASVQCGDAIGVYANSHGFIGRERGTHHSISCSLIAGQGDAMQRDGWYEYVRDANAFPAFASIGGKAAGRAAARLGARKLSTRECAVLFAPEVARSLLGHLVWRSVAARCIGARVSCSIMLASRCCRRLSTSSRSLSCSAGTRPAHSTPKAWQRANPHWSRAACCNATYWAAIRRASSG